MQRIPCLALLFLQFFGCPFLRAQSYQWQVIGRFQPSYGLSTVAFRDSLHGWTAYGSDSLYNTADGGGSWQAVKSPYLFLIEQLSLLDSSTVWAFGNDGSAGRIMVSTDGGRSWSLKYNHMWDLITGGVALSPQVILANGLWRAPNSGDSSLILRSTDGGTSWQRRTSLESQRMDRMQRIDSVTAFASYLPAQLLLRTTDAGASWERLPVPLVRALTFFNRTRALAHDPPAVLCTEDAGAHWVKISDSLGTWGGDDFQAMKFIFPEDTLSGWAFGGLFYHGGSSEGIYHTTDGGYHWQKESEGLTNDFGTIEDAAMTDDRHGWAVAHDGRILAYRPQTEAVAEPKETTLPKAVGLAQNYPNPFNGQTMLSYRLPVRTEANLRVYDVLGRTVATLAEGLQEAGLHEVAFKTETLSSGLYLARLSTASGFRGSIRMLLIR